MTTTTKQKLGWGTANTVVILGALVPVLWILALSFKDPPPACPPAQRIPAVEVADRQSQAGEEAPPSRCPGHAESFWLKLVPGNYRAIFDTPEFARALFNSIGIALISTFVAVVFASMAAYAVARLEFPGKRLLMGISLLIAMFPAISLVTPLFDIVRRLRLFDTWPGLIIPYITFSLPLAIYTLSAFFREIPWELEKAAKIDGATPFQAFTKVIAPLAAPGMITSAILVFIFCWNEFLFAISLTSTTNARTAPAAIAFFTGPSTFTPPWGSIAAAAMVITIPIVVFVLIFQRRIIAGLTSGAVKG